MTANAPIDFTGESKITLRVASGPLLKGKDGWLYLHDWARSIAERVEAQTIERLIRGRYLEKVDRKLIKRIYAPKSDKEEGKR